jgi:hypothetical protein
MHLMPEQAGMHVGARAGEQNAVDGLRERSDIGDLGRSGKHQGQRAGGLGDRAHVALADALRRELALHQMQAADDADDGFSAVHFAASALRILLMLGISLAGRGEKVMAVLTALHKQQGQNPLSLTGFAPRL